MADTKLENSDFDDAAIVALNLIVDAAEAQDSNDAMKLSQAALNCANALATIFNTKYQRDRS